MLIMLFIFRPHIHLSSCTMFAISITILVLSFLANLNRFFEYETQPIVASYPSYLDVQGAVVLEENLEAGEIIWKWNLVKPTKLRLDKDYAQVKFILLTIKLRKLWHLCLQNGTNNKRL